MPFFVTYVLLFWTVLYCTVLYITAGVPQGCEDDQLCRAVQSQVRDTDTGILIVHNNNNNCPLYGVPYSVHVYSAQLYIV